MTELLTEGQVQLLGRVLDLLETDELYSNQLLNRAALLEADIRPFEIDMLTEAIIALMGIRYRASLAR